MDPHHEAELARERHEEVGAARHGGRLRYVLTLRVFKLVESDSGFRFREHLEQVPDWSDTLIVDVGTNEAGDGLTAWAAWNSEVRGVNDLNDPITEGLPPERRHALTFEKDRDGQACRVDLPDIAKSLPILGEQAHLKIRIDDRLGETTRA